MAAPEPELVTAGVNLTALLPAVRQAGALIEQIKSDGVSARFKADASPVTAADEAANAVLVAALSDLYPDVPVISEEDTASHALAPDGLYFLVDPLDGTREFIRPDSNGAYTVNIGLIQNRRAVGGIGGTEARKGLEKCHIKERPARLQVGHKGRVFTRGPAAALLRAIADAVPCCARALIL